ncbi:MAG: hypothetical protein J0I98_01480 [Mesorhizobium sp.]|nr:hypothetical protein [Mesorhizobium sp.]MBN9241444.1 hypothetical protein [Mesorhizobium sp.]
MQYVYIVVLGLHVLTGVFWAGVTFTIARDPEIRAERFFAPQMGAATVAVITGALLWHFFHEGVFGTMELVLAIGIVAALAAAGVLGALVGPARRQLAGADEAKTIALRAQMAMGERIAGGLLALTVLCMAVAKLF